MNAKKKRLLIVISFIIVFVAFSYFIFNILDFDSILEDVGIAKYIIIPAVSVFGSNLLTSAFLYPILFFMEQSGMNLFVLALLAALGGTAGDLIFVFFGKKINEDTSKKRTKKIIDFFRRKQDSVYMRIFIFLFAAFFPVSNEFMTLSLGYIKYPVRKMILPLILGNILFYTILIYVGGNIWSIIFNLFGLIF